MRNFCNCSFSKISKSKRILFISIIVIVICSAVFLIWKYFFLSDANNLKDIKTITTGEEYEEYLSDLDSAYRNDKYGGATPKETLDLFIEALRKGDTDLAAKYFIPEKQKQMREDLRVGESNGYLSTLLGDFSRISGNYSNGSTSYTFYTIDNSKNLEFTYHLLKNKYTNKWKIESL